MSKLWMFGCDDCSREEDVLATCHTTAEKNIQEMQWTLLGNKKYQCPTCKGLRVGRKNDGCV